MKIKLILVTIILFFLHLNSFTFETTSYRIQALGKEFAGIVEDEYTDLFLNPAYIGKIKEKRIYGKFGPRDEVSPFSIVYINNNTGIFSENYVKERENEWGGERLEFNWQRWRKYYWRNRREYNISENDLGLIYGRKFGGNKYWGIKRDYKEERKNNLNKHHSTHSYVDPFKNKIVYIREVKEENIRSSSLYESYSVIGIILPNIDIAIILPKIGILLVDYPLLKEKSKLINKRQSLEDEDPDGDGKDYHGSEWVEKESELLEEIIEEDKKLDTNYSIKVNILRKCIIGINYQKYDVTGDGIKKHTRWISDRYRGITQTTLSTTNELIPTITGYQKNNSVSIRVGNKKELSETTLLAYCVGLKSNINKTYKIKNKKVITHSEYTDSGDKKQNKKLNIRYTSNEIEDKKEENYSISSSIGMEKAISNKLIVRLGMKKVFSISNTIIKGREEKGKVEKTVTTHEGVTTEILKPEVTTTHSETKDSSTSTYYSFGLCYKISDKFKIEFVSFSEILNLSDWEIQAYFRF